MVVFQHKISSDFRDDFLRSLRNGLITIAGIPNPNLTYGTDDYILGEAIGKIAELASLNGIASADAQMPDTATGSDLYRIAAIYSLALRPAGGSSGAIVLASSQTVGITSGQVLVVNGLRFQVSAGGTYSNGAIVPITSVDTGSATNLPAGTSLVWQSSPNFVAPTALVAAPGLIGGIDAETDQGLRARLLARIQNAPGGGNWAQFAEAASNSSSAVQQAFVYPTYSGPSTVLIAVTGAPTATSKLRSVNSIIVSQTVAPAIQAVTFEGVLQTVTTAQNVPINLSMGLSLPSYPSTVGWTDANQFPLPVIASPGVFSTGYCDVVAVTNSKLFTVNADSSTVPASGAVINLCWISKADWLLHTAQATVTGSSSPYTVTLTSASNPFVSSDPTATVIAVGDYVFPAAYNTSNYVAALLSVFANLGPGQIAVSSSIVTRAARRPYVSQSNPCDLGPSVLKILDQTGDEVLDAQYLYRQNISSAGQGRCPVASSVLNGPNILVPKNLAFYPTIS